MPLFLPVPPTPWYLAHESNMALVSVGGSGVLATNMTYLVGVYLPVPATVGTMRIAHTTTSAGNLDMGIFDNNGNRLDHTGVTAVTGASTIQSLALSLGNLALSAGRYYLALWVDNATDTYNRAILGTNSTASADALASVNANGTGSTNTTTGLLATFTAMGGTTLTNARLVQIMATLSGTGF